MRETKRIFLALILSGLCFFTPSYGQEQDSIVNEIQLSAITVNALTIPVANQDFGGMIGVLSKKDITRADPTIIAEQFNRIPGVLMQSGTYTTNRISIRGVGSRSAFATNKVRAYFGEIPLTDGGGETALEDIDLSFIESVEIIKGPNSTLYGSGLGGAILLTPKMNLTNTVTAQTTIGSFGLFRIGGLVTRRDENQSITVGVQRQTVDGYRQNNSSEKNTVFGAVQKRVGKNEFQILSIYQGLKAFIPSSINRTDFREDPSRAAANWAGAEGFEDYTKWLVGFGWKHQLNEHLAASTSFYANWKSNYEPRPFNILKDDLAGVGFRTRLTRKGEKVEWNTGTEGYRDTYNWQTFQNLLDSNDPGSTQGDLLSDNAEQRSFLNAFAQSIIHVSQNTHLEMGMNLNFTSYEFASQTEKRTMRFDPMVSPRLSVVQEINDQLNVFATVSHGFSPPSIDETLDANGDFNRDIQPETGWNREIGIKGAYQKLNFAFSAYSMDIRNLLVTRRTAEDVTFGKNAGNTRHNGLEASTEVLIHQRGENIWRVTGSYSLNDFKFRKFTDDGKDFSGNRLTGVPNRQASATLFQETKWMFSGVNFLAVSEIPITDDNSIFAKGYQLVNAFVGIRLPVTSKLKAELSYRTNNVFNETYASMLNINAAAFSSAEPRYYYPGLPRNHQVSLVIGY